MPSRLTPTAARCSRPGSSRACCRRSRFSRTCARSTAPLGAAVSTLWPAASPASRGVAPASGSALKTRATCGPRWPASSERFDPAMHSSRTSALLPLSNPSPTFRQWASESRRLSASVRETWAHRSRESGGGCWLPTLTKCGNLLSPSMTKWPAHARLATLTARDWRSGKASPATMARNSRPLSEQLGGLLHPDFADWYQGLPVGWTRGAAASHRSATRRFRRWLLLHSSSCAAVSSSSR